MATILCIEDEVELRINIAEELEDAGYDVKQACDGNVGLQMILKHEPDLVLCDINMPRKNGYRVLKEIREQHDRIFARMPFIFLTALADKERVLAGLKDGADAYLTKPIDFEMMLATVQASLRQMDRIKQDESRASSEEDNVLAVGSKLEGQIDNIMQIIQEAVESNDEFGASLEQVGSRMGDVSDPEQMNAVLATLVHAVTEKGQGNLDIKQRLAQTCRQVEQLKGELKSVRRDSLTDSLTGLANRKCFDQTLDKTIAQAKKLDQPLCFFMIDIDHFKHFNDCYGHQVGDSALKLVAATLKKSVRDCDHVARYGGEELVVILPETSLESAVEVAERIRQSVMEKVLIHMSTGENLGQITLSIGVGCHKPDDRAQSLIKRADACLYAAKHAGRNRVLCETSLPDNAAERGECAA